MRQILTGLLVFTGLLLPAVRLAADEAKASDVVGQIVKAAGGEEKLLKLFRFRERVLITSKPADPVAPDEKGKTSLRKRRSATSRQLACV
ncbi:MAG: hypothetical protein NT069_12680 [Planctomycetota bacterium]|nr:hypothetical protein [Planctomycetota bacterium]